MIGCVCLVLVVHPAIAAGPDLLGIRTLPARIVAARTASPGSGTAWLTPVADDPETIMEVDGDLPGQILAAVAAMPPQPLLWQPADWNRLHAHLQTLPPATLVRWWNESAPLWQRLADEQWQVTRQWLEEFLHAQAVYTPAELAAFSEWSRGLPADELLLVMDHLQAVHMRRQRQSAASDVQRRQALATNRELRSERDRATGLRIVSANPPTPVVVARPRQPVYAYRRRSLSQRISDVYVLRAIYGDDFIWWGVLP